MPPPYNAEGKVVTETPPRNVKNAVYNELTGSWMVPQPDPYTLENFQKACDNLATGKSIQSLTRAQADEFSAAEKLAPTHYALRIYPRNEEEQWSVEMTDDISVDYAPFNYSGLTAEEIERVPKTRAEIASPFEKSPYTVTEENQYTTDGGSTETTFSQLPILYTVWPVDKPLPDSLEYEVDYEVFLPRDAPATTRSAEDMSILETEAVALALGWDSIPESATTRAASTVVSGTVEEFFDPAIAIGTWSNGIPMSNLKLKIKLGSQSFQTSTDASGFFSINVSSIPAGSHRLYPIYQDIEGEWKITTETSTSPFSGVGELISSPGPGMRIWLSGLRQATNIFRAVEYFYGDASPKGIFARHYQPFGGTRIIAHDGPSATPGVKGSFTYPSFIINIYDEGDDDSYVIGTTLHELGHFSHCRDDISNGYVNYLSTILMIKEAAASYVGWYLGEEYYKSLGLSQYSDGADITGQGRQFWFETLDFPYTPLFVDLTDTYNQGWINDEHYNLMPFAVWYFATTNRTWPELRQDIFSTLAMDNSINFQTAKLEAYLGCYDYWFSTYPKYLTKL